MRVVREATIEAWFWSWVDYDTKDETRCWPWLGSREKGGYGLGSMPQKFVSSGKPFRFLTHRLAYELHYGDSIPAGFQLDHTCHNPAECTPGITCPHRRCCNPHHLEIVTAAENMRRGGKGARGATNRDRAKLDLASAEEIRQRYAAGGIPQWKLAAEFGVSTASICLLLSGKTWRG